MQRSKQAGLQRRKGSRQDQEKGQKQVGQRLKQEAQLQESPCNGLLVHDNIPEHLFIDLHIYLFCWIVSSKVSCDFTLRYSVNGLAPINSLMELVVSMMKRPDVGHFY